MTKILLPFKEIQQNDNYLIKVGQSIVEINWSTELFIQTEFFHTFTSFSIILLSINDVVASIAICVVNDFFLNLKLKLTINRLKKCISF